MSVSARITAIHLIENMERNDVYCKKLGLSDESCLRGKRTNMPTKAHKCSKPDCN